MDQKKISYLAIVLTFCLVLVAGGSFYLGTYFGKDDIKEVIEDKEKEEVNDEIEEENPTKELAISLLNKIDSSYLEEMYDFYDVFKDGQYVKLTQDNMGNKTKLDAAYQYAKKLGKVSKNADGNYGKYNEKLGHVEKYAFRLLTKDFDAAYLSIFGSDTKISYESFYEDTYLECFFENEYVNCYDLAQGDKVDNKSIFEYESSEYVGDFFVVNVIGLGFVGDVIYDAPFTNPNQNVIKEGYKYVVDSDYEQKRNEIFKKFKNQGEKYKVTFQKDGKDNYYWVSTELVK